MFVVNIIKKDVKKKERPSPFSRWRTHYQKSALFLLRSDLTSTFRSWYSTAFWTRQISLL